MATYPQHATIVPDNDFEADVSLSNEDGSGLNNRDFNRERQLFNPFDLSADDDILNVSSLSYDKVECHHLVLKVVTK